MSTPVAPNSPVKPAGRSLEEFRPLRPAEEKLLADCKLGKSAEIGADRPEASSRDNRIRAEFLRFLALGGDEQAPVHEHGVQVSGAWIEGKLDLEAARVPSNLTLFHCHFEITPVFRDARIAGTLNLDGCKMPGLDGGRLICKGSIFLRNGFVATDKVNLQAARIEGYLVCSHGSFSADDHSLVIEAAVVKGSVVLNQQFTAKGEVRLLGAQVGGDLDCSEATFSGHVAKGESCTDHIHALAADRASVKGSIFLNHGFTATRQVSFTGAEIGGDLDCREASFKNMDSQALVAARAEIKGSVLFNDFSSVGEVQLLGAQIGHNLECIGAKFDNAKGNTMVADGMVIKGALMFRNMCDPTGNISLTSSHVGQLIDDADSWGKNLVLDGFTYDSITGGAPTDTMTRLVWLSKQRADHFEGKNFTPQPWQQLIRCLHAMGHAEEARQIAVAREEHMRRIDRIGQAPSEWNKLCACAYRSFARGLHRGFGLLADYGYRPLKLVWWMLLVWLLFAAGYWWAAQNGVFAPTNPLVFDRIEYDHCRPGSDRENGKARVGNWYLCPQVPGEYTTFSPIAYSADLILPLVDLQQERDWAPIIPTPKADWREELLQFDRNHLTRLLVWFEILFGWVASLLLVAVLSGLTNRDRK